MDINLQLRFARRAIREFKIYDAAGSTTRFGNKEICQAKQKLWIICGPRGILNGVVILNATSN